MLIIYCFLGIMTTAMLCGVSISLIWLLLWLTLSSPIPSLVLSGLTLGSFFFYIFYFTIPGTIITVEKTTNDIHGKKLPLYIQMLEN